MDEMVIQGIKKKVNAIIKAVPFLALFSSIILLYDIFWALYFKSYLKQDDTSFRYNYWIQIGIFYLSFAIISILIGNIRKHPWVYKNKITEVIKFKPQINVDESRFIIMLSDNKWIPYFSVTTLELCIRFLKKLLILVKKLRVFILAEIYLIFMLILGWYSLIHNYEITFILFILFFLIPIIFMLLDAFRFIPADECLTKFLNYSIKPPEKNVNIEKEMHFLDEKDSGYFIIEKITLKNIHPFVFWLIIAIIGIILFYHAWGENHNMYGATFLIIFLLYVGLLLVHYRKSYYETLSELRDSINFNFKINNTEIFDRFIRRLLYIFFYAYFIYWVFSVSHFGDTNEGPNYFEVFISPVMSPLLSIFTKIHIMQSVPNVYRYNDILIFINFLLYFIGITYAMAMVSDGFGIVPVICNLSKDISSQIKKKEKEIDVYHPDKSAGFRPLGNFCFKMSFLIALPFIIGMPIQLYLYYYYNANPAENINPLYSNGIANYLINDSLNVAFIGVGIAGATIFIFSVYYINKLIENAKKEKLKILMNKYKKELDSKSSEIANIDSAIKKIEGIVLPPYGKTNVIKFFGTLIIPTISILLNIYFRFYK